MDKRSLLTFTVSIFFVLAFFTSCDDDNGGSNPTPPNVTAPQSQTLTEGASVDLTFEVSIPNGYQSSSVSATNGNATISSEPSARAASGDVVVNFTPNASGAGTVTLTVTDQEGLSDDATAAVTVGQEQTTFRITDNISEDTVWETGNTYILAGRISVLAGVTLEIEPGVLVKGEAGTGSNATALLVARDATLNANGEAGAPIIFTSVADEITPEQIANGDFISPNLDPDINGLWGGVLILGNAPISASSGVEAQIEGIPSSDTNGLYGGNDPNDSSGSISYISIRHGGANIGEGNEINGLTLGGVGTGTSIDNVEIIANQDDGVEWFGGTVNVTNVFVWNNGDDGLDTDQAWDGTVTNSIIVNPAGSGFELDGPEGSATSVDGHFITDATIYKGRQGELIDVDATTDVTISNVLLLGLPVDGDGNPAASFSSDYPDYAAQQGFGMTSLEAILSPVVDPDGNEVSASFALSDFFPQALIDNSDVVEVADLSSATVGADASVFGWTWASQAGVLQELGLE